MKTIIFFVCLFFISCTIIVYDDINKYKGSTILNIEADTVNSIISYRLTIKDSLGNYSTILLREEYAKFLKINEKI